MRVLNKELEPVFEIDKYKSLIFNDKYTGAGEFQLVINGCDSKIQKGMIIMIDANRFAIVRYISFSEENNETTIKGFDLRHILWQRITIPPDGQSNDTIKGNAETVMKHYVQRNCLDIENMKFTRFKIAENKNRGTEIEWSSRYQNLLEEIEKISKQTMLGFNITLDKKRKELVFDVAQGTDRSSIQESCPPIIFSSDYDNLRGKNLVDSNMNYSNYVLVGGQGEGAERTIIEQGDSSSDMDLFVKFIDARDLDSEEKLKTRATEKLTSEFKELFSFDAIAINKGNYLYNKDWFLGDIVTLKDTKWNIEKNIRITNVEIIKEESGEQTNITFGDVLPTLKEKIQSLVDK